jgi:predicted extracellular nuclease
MPLSRLAPRRFLSARTPICVAALLALSSASQAAVVISQVYGGNGSTYASDYVELFNNGSAVETLSNWSIQYASATGTGTFASNGVVTLNGTLQPGQYYLVRLSTSTTGTALPAADASGNLNLSASAGKVILVNTNTGLSCNGGSATCNAAQLASIVDLVGYGSANFSEGSAAAASSSTQALLRAQGGCTDTQNNSSDFSLGTPAPRNSATTVSLCSGSGSGTGGGSGTGTGGNTGVLTPIPQIQGDTHLSPKVGQTIATSGVVTKVTNTGFFLQDPVGDGNPKTSDGIFVYTGSAPTVSANQAVTLTATVAEFNTGAAGNAHTTLRPVTELINPSNIVLTGSGQRIAPTVITLPATQDELEAVEGMLVTIQTPLTASQNYFLGRFGQVTLSAQGRLVKPTNMYRAGSPEAIAMAASNAQRQILLDDGTSAQNPLNTPYIGADNTLRAGDTLDSITGVIDFGLSTSTNTGLASYKIHPIEPITFTRANPRSTRPESPGGNIKVASFNVLNYFTTFTDGTTATGQSGQGCSLGGAVSTANCRGADNLAEFQRQRTKIVKALAALDADVVGLMEIQNSGNAAVQNLVDALNAELGSNSYASVALPAAGTGTDAIRVAMIYKPGALTPAGAPLSDADAINNRPPLAQTFTAANGEKFSVVVNHFKSKSCSGASGADADHGDGQGCYNDRRIQQANRLLSFLQTVTSTAQDNDVVVIGDLNAYGKEDPIVTLTQGGLTNLVETFNGNTDYSYVFDGEAGYIDHALSNSAALVSGVVHWHINADEPSVIDYERNFKRPSAGAGCYVSSETSCSVDLYSATPYRSSDHDPVVVGLNLYKSINGTARGDSLTGTAGDDRITGGEGADLITTGGGRDVIVYNSLRDALDTITDFTPGMDRIDLSAIANTLRASNPGVDLLAGGFIQVVDTTAGAQIRIDTDGSAGSTAPRPLVTLRGVSAAQIVASRDLILP